MKKFDKIQIQPGTFLKFDIGEPETYSVLYIKNTIRDSFQILWLENLELEETELDPGEYFIEY